MRYERRDREKERRLRNSERETKRHVSEKRHRKYEENSKEDNIIDMSYEDYVELCFAGDIILTRILIFDDDN